MAERVFRDSRLRRIWTAVCFIGVASVAGAGTGGGFLHASEWDDAVGLYRSGDYKASAAMATAAIEGGTWNSDWSQLLIRNRLAIGEYEQAVEVYETALRRYTDDLPLRILGGEAYRYAGDSEQATAVKHQIFEMLRRSPGRYSGSENLVAAGRYFARRGEDARKVLELFFDRVRRADPNYAEVHVATAELALSKHDYAVAAESLARAAELEPDDPQIAYLTARAWAPSDPKRADAALARALQINPRHVPSLLMQANEWIDRERYEQAEESLDKVQEVNAREPLLWAYRAVLAHLRGDEEAEQKMRETALATWKENPQVDHLIGRELSRKYRFAEGAAAQRRALEFDPTFIEARFQLAQDLLRLGDDEIGWELAEWVNQEDAYNVVAYNLMTLQDELKKYPILRRGNLLVRMEAHEAEVYGEEVLDLLQEASEVLCAKYNVTPDGPIVVEIFPRQQDFAIRTFGLPGGDGFLGVCFGRVITANSPQSQGENPANWKSVLWHEFCHVVTLEKTNNRMPRWLSEGISVYEERQRDPVWGQRMTPTFRKMLLGDDLVPISRLSGAFLEPKTPMHLQLAYYQSSLAVEHLIERYGMPAMQRILVDLGVGMPINETLERHTGSLKTLDEEYAAFVKKRAEAFGDPLDWSDEEVPERGDSKLWAEWLEKHPNNYWGLRGQATALIAERRFEEAEAILNRIRESLPEDAAPEGTLQDLAAIAKETGDVEQELKLLKELAAARADGFRDLIRLMELEAEREQWEPLSEHAKRALEVNPLLPDAHRFAAQAAAEMGEAERAIRPLKALATMDPVDPAGLHFRLAEALAAAGEESEAKREVLMALEEAPKFRNAHKLLLELVREKE